LETGLLETVQTEAAAVSGYPRGYTANMRARLSDVTGTATTTVAGVLLAALSLSAFGAASTLSGFLALFLLTALTHRAISRR
jgi:hypothetical protein